LGQPCHDQGLLYFFGFDASPGWAGSGNRERSFCSARISRSVSSTTDAGLKLGGIERGGYSLNVAANLKTSAPEMEKRILELAHEGKTDKEIAALLTQGGYRSPRRATVLPSTVRVLRLRHSLFQTPSQSHPRRIPGSLTVSQIARSLGIPANWIYDRIYNYTSNVAIDSVRRLYLFPDQPKTIRLFKQLRAGKLKELRF
jgi:hypothetical protein